MSETSTTKTHHPDYVRVWKALVILLALSIGFGFIPNPLLANALVFGVAFVKALIVASTFMHLLHEGWMLRLIAASGFVCIAIVIVALLPDIVYVYGR